MAPFNLSLWSRNLFRSTAPASLILGLLSFNLHAGQIYGSLSSSGKPVAAAPLVVSCSGVETKGITMADGTYRVNVAPEGRCTLSLSSYVGTPSVVVFSYDKPTLYDLEVVRRPDGSFELRIR